jgi:hypothetical protein
MRIVVDAMEHKKFNKNDVIIKQGAYHLTCYYFICYAISKVGYIGEDGEDFYVLESGECHCFLKQPGMPYNCVSMIHLTIIRVNMIV